MLLLDSQAALWLLDDSPRLGPMARQEIRSATRVHISAASVWELTIKSMLGKISVPERLAERFEREGLVVTPITAAHAEGLREFPELVRHDPFDRLLMAQASRDNMRLMTADRVLLRLNEKFVVDATA